MQKVFYHISPRCEGQAIRQQGLDTGGPVTEYFGARRNQVAEGAITEEKREIYGEMRFESFNANGLPSVSDGFEGGFGKSELQFLDAGAKRQGERYHGNKQGRGNRGNDKDYFHWTWLNDNSGNRRK
ncbi:MAG TPA: hypothetical protein VK663_11610, partial [Burkholderiales bacterium]|nr:hypothetical protein [Burkholderiales bacterium]